ncbi:MAG: TPM domain-containing protein [Psychrobacter sp.]|nr:TPM domain-containing protein [Psychrobacter sp.]
MGRLFGMLIFFSVSSIASAVSVEDIAMPKTYNNMFVSDTADIISEVEEKQLDDVLNSHFEETGNQIAVVTTVDTKGSGSPRMFATKLFNTWGLGDADKDNGLLVLLSISDRRIEFETGYGLEGVLPDVIQSRIQRELMVPYFKKGDYEQGLLRGTYATLNKIKEGMDSEVALAQADVEKKAAEIEALPIAQMSDNTIHANTDGNGDSVPMFFKILMGFGLFISSGAGLVYFFRLFSQTSHEPESAINISKLGIVPESDNAKKYCGYCHKPTHQTPVIGSDFKKMHFSPYQRKLVYFNAGKINLLMCDACSYINTDLDIKKKLTECTVCGEKARYEFLSCTMRFENYLNVYIDRVNRIRDLNDVNFKGVVNNWQDKAYAVLSINHCFSCFSIKAKPLEISVPKPAPKPKPVSSSTKSRKNNDDDDSGGYRSGSYGVSSGGYGSSSKGVGSSGSGNSWGGSDSGFGGGDSGGGGAGSSW